MLAIRMQRTGRKGHAMFRVIVQDSHRTPTSGKVVAYVGSYDPHTKTAALTKDKIDFYLEHGAQPSERVVRLLTAEGVKLPTWVSSPKQQDRSIRHPEKLRRNRPAGQAEAEPAAAPEASAEAEAEVQVETVPEATVSESTEASQPAEADEATKPAE